VDDADLAAELLERMARDKEARNGTRSSVDRAAWQRVWAIDAENTAWLKAILAERGWPHRADIGERAATAVWLLAQHADRDRDFQRECLALLAAAVAAGDADARHLAYLTDRVRRADGLSQVYGTQFWYEPDGTLAPQPIEDPEHLDERRLAVGLSTFAEYEARMNEREVSDPPRAAS
jgi:hypothetical protein